MRQRPTPKQGSAAAALAEQSSNGPHSGARRGLFLSLDLRAGRTLRFTRSGCFLSGGDSSLTWSSLQLVASGHEVLDCRGGRAQRLLDWAAAPLREDQADRGARTRRGLRDPPP